MQEEQVNQQNESPTATLIPISEIISDGALVSTLERGGIKALAPSHAELVKNIIEGHHVQVSGSRHGRHRAIVAGLIVLRDPNQKKRALIIADTDNDVERFGRVLQDLSVNYFKLNRRNGNPGRLNTAAVFIGTAQGILDALDQGIIDGSNINRVVIHDCENPIRAGKIEELLNLLHDLPTAQLIVSASEVTMGIANFIKRFLTTPKVVVSPENEVAKDEELGAARAAPERASQDRGQQDRGQPRQNAPRDRGDRNGRGRNDEESSYQADDAAPPAPRAVETPKIERKIPEGAEHVYIELPSELLAKPNALADLIEGSGSPTTVVFCNSPSDADLTDVMLRKRGIATKKLIGFVSPARAEAATKALHAKEITALVLTDISGKEVSLSDVALVINYSTHNDPDIYTQRAGVVTSATTPPKIISFVTALDIANFHYLRKLMNIEFSKGELPTKEAVLGAKIATLSATAKTRGLSKDERLATIVGKILSDEARDDILALLLSNTIDVLPSLQSSHGERGSDRGHEEGEGRRERFDRRDGRDDRRGGRGDRRGRRDDFRNDESRGDDDRGGEQRAADDGAPREDRFQDGDRGRGRQNSRRDDMPRTPPSRDVRVYIGHGSKAGVTADSIKELVTGKAELPADSVKRTVVRDLYSFVDVPEQVGDLLITKLSELELEPGTKSFVRKAVLIPTPRPDESSDNSQNNSDNGGHSESFEASGSEESSAVAEGSAV